MRPLVRFGKFGHGWACLTSPNNALIVLDLVFSLVISSKQKNLRYWSNAPSDIVVQKIILLIGREDFGIKLAKQNCSTYGVCRKNGSF